MSIPRGRWGCGGSHDLAGIYSHRSRGADPQPIEGIGHALALWDLYAFNNPCLLREEQMAEFPRTRGVWHTLAVEVRGTQIKIGVDGVFAFEYVDDKSPFLQGTVGLNRGIS